MKRHLIAALAAVFVTSCSQEQPEYVSPFSDSGTATTSTAPPQVEPSPPQLPYASFVDDFDRADTNVGLGDGWDLRTRDKNVWQPASDGFIKNGYYTYSGRGAVYAARKFRGMVRRIGAFGRFQSIRFGPETVLALGITPNDQLTADMVLLTAKRSGWRLIVRRGNGAYETVAEGTFAAKLDLDRDYQFELDATDDSVTVRVPGVEETHSVSTVGLLGDLAFWQEYPTSSPSGDVFDFDIVWAAEDGQPLSPVVQ